MIVLICGYNDADTLDRTLDSVKSFFKVHYFDGRYKDYPGESWESTDGTREIVAKYPNAIFHEAVAGETQCEKRTRMLSVVDEGQFFLKLDGDEVLLDPGKEIIYHVNTEVDVYWGWTISPVYDYPYVKPYIFKKQPGMHYAGKHHYLFDSRRKLIASDQNMGNRYKHETLNFRIFNRRSHRSPQRTRTKFRFIQERAEGRIRSEGQVYPEQKITPHPDRAREIRKESDILKQPDKPEYTYSILFSRPWAVERYFKNLEQVLLPDSCEVICVVDTNNRKFYEQVQDKLRASEWRWNGITTFMTGEPAPFEKRKPHERRFRIAKNFHIILSEARGSILLGSEDDSLAPEDAYVRLIEDLDQADFAQGTIVGRWEPIIPAWHVEDKDDMPYRIWTGWPKMAGLEIIRGMGWYCFAAKTDMLRSVKLHWDYCRSIGPDWHMGYDLYKKGFTLIHDHDVHVTHFGEDFELTIKDPVVVKEWIKNGTDWSSKFI